MARALHLVLRTDHRRPDPFCFDLMVHGRVAEFYEAPTHAVMADLSLAERDTPELCAVLQWADEVYAHGIHPEVVLQALPMVRPEVLRETTLYLSGPWKPLRKGAQRRAGYLQVWPGPVCHDGRGEIEDVRACAADNIATFDPAQLVDLHRADLLPRACGSVALDLGDGRRLANIVLSAELSESLRRVLAVELPAVAGPGVVVQAVDEAELPKHERAPLRRVSQAFVAPPLRDLALLEATAQAVPTIIADEFDDGVDRRHEVPEHAVYLSGDDVALRVIACVRSWTMGWAAGNAAPVRPFDRERYLL